MPDVTPPSGAGRQSSALDLRSTTELLGLARAGQGEAIDALFARCLPPLRRWARGRLPAAARDLLDNEDLVQDTVINVLRRLNAFEAHHEGALQAYLRQAILNRIRDESRRVARRAPALELNDVHADPGASPLELAIGAEALAGYEAALQRLSPIHRQAIVARLELQYSYEQIAQALERPNANAARSLVVRALYRLCEQLPHDAVRGHAS